MLSSHQPPKRPISFIWSGSLQLNINFLFCFVATCWNLSNELSDRLTSWMLTKGILKRWQQPLKQTVSKTWSRSQLVTKKTYISNVNLHLEDLFVDPEYRGKGYGTALLKKLAKIVVDRGYGRFEWTCLSWNQPSIDLYLSLGAKQKDWEVFHLTGDELKEFARD